MTPGLNDLIELQNVFKNQTPSSPVWFQVIDLVVGTLLEIEVQRAAALSSSKSDAQTEKQS